MLSKFLKNQNAKKTAVKIVISILLSIIFAIFLFEILVKIFYYNTMKNPDRQLDLMGFHAWPNSIMDGVKINSQGFTGDEVNHDKPPHTIRILTLGGSVLFNGNITEKLKAAIQSQTQYSVELMGGGIRSHTSASSLIKYKYYLYKYKFDVVFIYDGINDLWVNDVAPEDFKADYSHYMPQYKRGWLLDNFISFRLIHAIFFYIYKKPEIKKMGAEFLSEKSLDMNIRELIAMVRNDGGRPVLMTFAYYIPDGYTDEKFMNGAAGYSPQLLPEGDYWPIKLWGDVGYVTEGMRRHNAVIRKIASELHVDLIDQEKMFDDLHEREFMYFGDICHLSPIGIDYFVNNVSEYWARSAEQIGPAP